MHSQNSKEITSSRRIDKRAQDQLSKTEQARQSFRVDRVIVNQNEPGEVVFVSVLSKARVAGTTMEAAIVSSKAIRRVIANTYVAKGEPHQEGVEPLRRTKNAGDVSIHVQADGLS